LSLSVRPGSQPAQHLRAAGLSLVDDAPLDGCIARLAGRLSHGAPRDPPRAIEPGDAHAGATMTPPARHARPPVRRSAGAGACPDPSPREPARRRRLRQRAPNATNGSWPSSRPEATPSESRGPTPASKSPRCLPKDLADSRDGARAAEVTVWRAQHQSRRPTPGRPHHRITSAVHAWPDRIDRAPDLRVLLRPAK
jgi:hypothetical protein